MSDNTKHVWLFAIAVIGFILLTITLRMEVNWSHNYSLHQDHNVQEGGE